MNLGSESETVEFKKSTSELKEGIASIAAILNKQGHGELYFGVKNNGDVCGQDVSESTLRKISQAIGNSIEPTIYPTIETLQSDSGLNYIKVSFEGQNRPYSCYGKYRIRSADEDLLLSNEELASMFAVRRARQTPWDEWESERPLSDIDAKELTSFIDRGNKSGRIPFEYGGVADTLERLGLLRNGRLTNAAEVLFCPSRHVALKMGVLATHARTEILDLHQEQGTLFQLVRNAELYILNNTRRRFIITGVGPREEVPEIPRDAVREILFNAFVHRDWMSRGCVQVDIFNDAVEVFSPGWFIEGQDPEAHLKGTNVSSVSRNMLIASTLYKSRDIESYGTGIPRVRDALQGAGIEFEYIRMDDGTKFVFHRNDAFNEASDEQSDAKTIKPKTMSPDEREEVALKMIAKNGRITVAELKEATSVSRRTANDTLKKMSSEDKLVWHGNHTNDPDQYYSLH